MKHLALCLLVLPLGLCAEDKELPLVLPKSVALGTPRPMKINNLEPVSSVPRKLPKVPAAAVNLAKGCNVTQREVDQLQLWQPACPVIVRQCCKQLIPDKKRRTGPRKVGVGGVLSAPTPCQVRAEIA